MTEFPPKSASESAPSKSHKTRWLILSHGFNMDGRAASQIVTDKMPYFLAVDIFLVQSDCFRGGSFKIKEMVL